MWQGKNSAFSYVYTSYLIVPHILLLLLLLLLLSLCCSLSEVSSNLFFLVFLSIGSLNALLRELVTEFTLADNLASTTTSLLRSMCHHDDSILLGSWLEDTDQQSVEEQLQTNSAAGSGTPEHDPNSVYMTDRPGTNPPDPLPLGVAVIDAAVLLFGKAFPSVSSKHRQQLLSHFKECITQAKSGRQQAIQINIFTAFLAALRVRVRRRILKIICGFFYFLLLFGGGGGFCS